MPIKLLLTGGTFDKQYNELTGELGFSKTHIQEILNQARSRVELNIQELMLIDSLDMTSDQRQQILKVCQQTEEDKIVITHGTDSIVETAHVLGKNITDKTIVLFGAMIPFVFGGSDALFDFGTALAAVQALDNGVYITMNGKIFAWDKVVKNRELGEFQST